MENREIRKIMERETAQKQIEEIKLRICGVDIDALCENEEIKESTKELPYDDKRKLENAWMCGLIYFSEEKNCLVQKLIKPIKSGEIEASELEYKYTLNLKNAVGVSTKDQVETTINVLSRVTGRPKQLLGEIHGQDVQFAQACIAFFEM